MGSRTKGDIVLSLFDTDPYSDVEFFAPAVYEGYTLPTYMISNKGNMIGKFNKPIKGVINYRICPYTKKRIPTAHVFELSLPIELASKFYREGYVPSDKGTQRLKDGSRRKMAKSIMAHRCVMETFCPLGSRPIEYWTQEEWDNTPKSIKIILRSALQVDHIDCNPCNNDIRNLRWVTMKDNNWKVKKQILKAHD